MGYDVVYIKKRKSYATVESEVGYYGLYNNRTSMFVGVKESYEDQEIVEFLAKTNEWSHTNVELGEDLEERLTIYFSGLDKRTKRVEELNQLIRRGL